jgi:hypothetical protein
MGDGMPCGLLPAIDCASARGANLALASRKPSRPRIDAVAGEMIVPRRRTATRRLRPAKAGEGSHLHPAVDARRRLADRKIHVRAYVEDDDFERGDVAFDCLEQLDDVFFGARRSESRLSAIGAIF